MATLLAEAEISLPAPRLRRGQPLMTALARRRSTRDFGTGELALPVLSDLLWAAYGINRRDTGGRTAPSAKHWQEIDIYVARSDGLFHYDPAAHALKRLLISDIRAATGAQEFVAVAPINLVYVTDLAKVDATDPIERRFYCAADAGCIAQNVYLFCASEGLGTVVRGLLDRRQLARTMGLAPRQRVLLAQTVGYPA